MYDRVEAKNLIYEEMQKAGWPPDARYTMHYSPDTQQYIFQTEVDPILLAVGELYYYDDSGISEAYDAHAFTYLY